VFSDSAGAVLAARRLADYEDTVGVLTSSKNNLRRNCSQYEPTTSVHHHRNDQVIQQQQQQQHNEEEEEDDDGASDVTAEAIDRGLAQHVEAQYPLPELVNTLETDSSTGERQNDSRRATGYDSRPNDDVSRSEERPAIATGPQRDPTIPVQQAPVQVALASVHTDADIQRPAPPVSRVKPMIRQAARSTTGTDAGSSSEQQAGGVSQPAYSETNATAAAATTAIDRPVRRAPVPLPAKRHHNTNHPAATSAVNTVEDIPDDLSSLGVADVAKCVSLLGLGQSQADLMATRGVDGPQLMKITASQLSQEFHFAPLDANKLARFSRGWRPA